MFSLETMLSLGLTNDKLQEELVNTNSQLQIETQNDVTLVWIYDIKVQVEIIENKITRMWSLRGQSDTQIYNNMQQQDLINQVQFAEESKIDKSPLVVAAINQKIKGLHGRLMELGNYLENIIGGCLK